MDLNRFYKIPGIENYKLSKTGEVFSLESNKLLKPINLNGRGYVYYIMYINKKRKAIARHRLLCVTFKPNTDKSKTEIDHINGIAGDDRLENLEWVTHKENVQRYHKQQNKKLLRKPVLVYYINDGAIVEYENHCIAAKYLDIHRYELLRRLKLGSKFIHPDLTIVKWKDDPNEFPKGKELDYLRLKCSRKTSVKVYNHFTKEVKIFDSLKLVSKFLNVSQSTITQRTNGSRFKVFPGGWEIKYIWDETPWTKLTKTQLLRLKYSSLSSRPLEVININNGEIKIFNTCKSAAEFVGLKPTALSNRLHYKNNRPTKDGYIFRYYDLNNEISQLC